MHNVFVWTVMNDSQNGSDFLQTEIVQNYLSADMTKSTM